MTSKRQKSEAISSSCCLCPPPALPHLRGTWMLRRGLLTQPVSSSCVALGCVWTISKVGRPLLHSSHVSYIPFPISKLLCVWFLTQNTCQAMQSQECMGVSMGEMKRTDCTQEQTEQVNNMQEDKKQMATRALFHRHSLFQCFDTDVKRSAGFSGEASSGFWIKYMWKPLIE